MKAIIQRALPLNVRYAVIDKKYIPLSEGFGCACANCGKPIANIATVKSENGTYYIGFDCLETFLLNNNLLDGFSGEDLNTAKRTIATALRFSKRIKEVKASAPLTGIKFMGIQFDKWVELFWLLNGQTESRNNENFKVNGISYPLLIDTIKNIFPSITIITNY